MKVIKAVGRGVRILATALLCLIIGLNLFIIAGQFIQKKEVVQVFGYSQMIVISGSMEPAISVGDMVIVHETGDYQPGDVITYYDGSAYVTHRLTEKIGDRYITQGDANNAPDEPVLAEQIIGKVVVAIPKAGKLILFLRTPAGIVMLAVLGYALIMIPGYIDRKRRKAAEKPSEPCIGGYYEGEGREGKTE